MSACPVKNKQWFDIVNKVGLVEAHRLFVKNGNELPNFGPFTTINEVRDYLINNYRDKLSLYKGKLYVKTGGNYAQYLKNLSFIREQLGNIQKVYEDVAELRMEQIPKVNERFGIGRKKAGVIILDPKALDNHYSIYKEYDNLKQEGNYTVSEGEVKPKYEQRVDYSLRIVDALQKIQRNKFESPKLQGWLNDLQKSGVPKEQIEFFKESAKDGMTKEEIITSIAANYSYTIETNIPLTVGEYDRNASFRFEGDQYHISVYGDSGYYYKNDIEIEYEQYEKARQDFLNKTKRPTQYYSNLTVPGGANYTENEIRTPDITPSIKGHAQFSTDQGIGWFRSDEQIDSSQISEEDKLLAKQYPFIGIPNEENLVTKNRRILEIQSDLFQKGRGKEQLADDLSTFPVEENPETGKRYYDKDLKGNKFLQLLNKDNNWVTFFIKSIIQDSAKKGYEKVLFPKGETAAKVEGHTTIEDDITRINNQIDIRKQELDNIVSGKTKDYDVPDIDVGYDGMLILVTVEYRSDELKREIKQLEEQKQSLKSQGIEKLKPIEGFYEIRVGNILNKIGNIKIITDEYGNQWYEYTIQPGDISKAISLQRKSISKLSAENREDFEKKKQIMLKSFPSIKDVIEDYNITSAGTLETNNTVIRVNPNYWTTDTIGHEFGHLLIDILGGMNNPLVKAAYDKLVNTPLFEEVKAVYLDLYENDFERFQKEVLAQAIGEKTANLFEEEQDRSWWERFLMRLFDRLKRLVGIEKDAVRELAKMVVGQRKVPQKLNNFDTTGSYEQRVRDYEVSSDTFVGKAEKFRRKAVESLEQKYAIYRKKDIQQKVESIGDTLSKLQELKDDPIESVKVFQNFAIEQTNRIYEEYGKAKRRREQGDVNAFNARSLSRWKDYVTGFDLLEEIVDIIRSPKTGRTSEENKLAEVLDLEKLTETIQRKREIQSAYREEGLDIVTRFLLPYTSHIEAKYKEIFERDYNKLNKEEKQKLTVDEYINQRLKDDSTTLQEKTRQAVMQELVKAYGDVGQLTRWLDNVLDSPDLIVSAMVRAFADTDRQSRLERVELRDEFLSKLRKLEKFQSEKRGALKKDSAFYDFMLEKDEHGNYTGYLVDVYLNSMWESYNQYSDFLQKKVEAKEMSFDEMQELKRIWKNQNTPLKKKEYNKAKDDYIDQLIKEGYLTQEDKRKIKINDTNYFASLRNERLKAHVYRIDQLVSNDVGAEKLSNWIAENTRKFRVPNSDFKWVHNEEGRLVKKQGGWYNYNQWQKLVKMAGGNVRATLQEQQDAVRENKTNDPRIDFYNFITNKVEDLQKGLPFAHRLRKKLPSVMKDFNQRIKEGDSIGTLIRGFIKHNLAITPEHTEIGDRSQLVDESGNPVNFLPIYYTGKIDIKDQSFDLADIYFKYLSMAIDYKEKSQILPEMELARYFLNNRDIIERDSKGNLIKNAALRLFGGAPVKKIGTTSNIAAQLNDWFEAVIYGNRSKEGNKLNILGIEVDTNRALDLLNRYTALNLLGVNFIQGVANISLGSALQTIEAYGGEYYSSKDFAKAKYYYLKNYPGLVGDIGRRNPENIVNILNEQFDILNEYVGGKFRKNTRFRQMLTTNTLFFTSHAGEHMMQSKVMLAMLNKLRAKDKEGNVLGSMLDMAKVKGGKLIFESKEGIPVANFGDTEQFQFESNVKRLLSRLHGEYSDIGRVAMQRYALGRMAYMFRKFIVPGFRRRWGNKYVNNFTGDFTEGNYRTFGRFAWSMLKDLNLFHLTMWQTNWQDLTRVEKANVKRTLGELVFLASAIILINALAKLKANDDDEEWLYDFLSYQALRLRAELAFFINPSASMQILRSPAAAMSMVENTIKLFGQLSDPLMNGDLQFERYQRGPWKGRLKINKTLLNYVPAMKQVYRLRDINEQLSWFKQ